MRSFAPILSIFLSLCFLLSTLPVQAIPDPTRTALFVVITFPENDKAYNDTTMEAIWKFENNDENITSEYSLDLAPYISVGNETTALLNGLSEGYHDLSVRCMNGFGEDASVSVSFRIDTCDPNVQFTQTATLFTNLDPVMMEWITTDNGSGMDHVETRLDGGEWVDKGSANREIVSLEYDGQHIYEIRAFDRAGNSLASNREIVLDRERPDLEVLSPDDEEGLNSSTVRVSWDGDDALSGISYFEVQMDSTQPYSYKEPAPHEYQSVADGRHEIRVTAFDKAGNIRTVTLSVEVDTFAPYVVQCHPQGDDVGVDASIWIATSETLVPGSIEVYVNGIPVNVTVNGGQIDIVRNWSLGYGTGYTVTMSGRDRSGNGLMDLTWTFNTTDTGWVRGFVVDNYGNFLSNLRVSLENNRSDRSDRGGAFNISTEAGSYLLSVNKIGFTGFNTTVIVEPGVTTDMGWITLEQTSADDVDEIQRRMVVLLVSILVVVFLMFLMVALYVWKKHQTHGISHEDREQMIEILRHFDVSTRIHEVDCYRTLGVNRKASAKEIKRAYRTLAAKYHPDKVMHKEDFDIDEAHNKMREINAAKSILMDEEKRDLQDRILKVTGRY
ncbi:MAG: DnaJ domain-containing protein [Candidatus Thermoplasmatota archaeon]|nr:DnaJ domain-containing protein [Candidatus Thermoplasmatota archaeon]